MHVCSDACQGAEDGRELDRPRPPRRACAGAELRIRVRRLRPEDGAGPRRPGLRDRRWRHAARAGARAWAARTQAAGCAAGCEALLWCAPACRWEALRDGTDEKTHGGGVSGSARWWDSSHKEVHEGRGGNELCLPLTCHGVGSTVEYVPQRRRLRRWRQRSHFHHCNVPRRFA
jgi:hypothetical protein